MSAAERATQSARAVEHLLADVADRRLSTVAAYASFGTEPSTAVLLDRLRADGIEVLLPAVLASKDLTWVDDAGVDRGIDAITGCGLIVVPGLAADRAGNRLGRGGGSYDRALARVAVDVPRVLLLFDGELVDAVPVEPHDATVSHVALPSAVLRTGVG